MSLDTVNVEELNNIKKFLRRFYVNNRELICNWCRRDISPEDIFRVCLIG